MNPEKLYTAKSAIEISEEQTLRDIRRSSGCTSALQGFSPCNISQMSLRRAQIKIQSSVGFLAVLKKCSYGIICDANDVSIVRSVKYVFVRKGMRFHKRKINSFEIQFLC